MLRRWLTLLSPVLLIVIEWEMRSVSGVDTQAFVGPTLASVGLGILIPLMQPRPNRRDPAIPASFYEEAERYHMTVSTEREHHFDDLCLFLLIPAIVLWTWTVYLSVKAPHSMAGPFAVYDYWGIVNYIVGAALTEIREHI